MRASVIISNHNYGRFLRDAIDSALRQTYPDAEVIVVDDGSTDDSRSIIHEYGQRVVPVLKEQGGLASALNAGFAVSCGDVVLFLDADDVLVATALELAVEQFRASDAAKVHWPLMLIGPKGRWTGRVMPRNPARGDVLQSVLRNGPAYYAWPSTSGNAWRRSFLEAVMPIPEVVTSGPELYLSALLPFYGPIACIREPQAFYRLHKSNMSWALPLPERIRRGVVVMDFCIKVFSDCCRARGVIPTPDRWKSNSWFHNMHRAILGIEAVIPVSSTFILIDNGYWGITELSGRRCVPFHVTGGPDNLASAIAELQRLQANGAGFLAVVWPKLWWLDHFSDVAAYLHKTAKSVVQRDEVVVFELEQVTTAA